MKRLYISLAAMLSLLGLESCTYSVILNHTEGTATDLVDENQSPTADVKPNISMPLTP